MRACTGAPTPGKNLLCPNGTPKVWSSGSTRSQRLTEKSTSSLPKSRAGSNQTTTKERRAKWNELKLRQLRRNHLDRNGWGLNSLFYCVVWSLLWLHDDGMGRIFDDIHLRNQKGLLVLKYIVFLWRCLIQNMPFTQNHHFSHLINILMNFDFWFCPLKLDRNTRKLALCISLVFMHYA